ncbi:MAG: antitoxin VapB36 [Proteobacteria bacterium]|nr:antitoxin VapB36 [Pseudomonadota bacterium]
MGIGGLRPSRRISQASLLAGRSMVDDQDDADGRDKLLDVLSREVWPLLSDHRPVTKAQREEILGYDPDSGVS